VQAQEFSSSDGVAVLARDPAEGRVSARVVTVAVSTRFLFY
jgi:hypothetical protein